MAATRREVAERAGVSLRTVSNVVNDFPHIADKTRARVKAAIDELDYRPSEIARILQRGRSGLIALVLPELDTPYFAELTRAFVEQGSALGYTVVIDQTDGDVVRERQLITATDSGSLFDGLIVSPLALRDEDLAGISLGRPVVILGEETHAGFDQVRIDNVAAASAAVAHLISQGCRRIAAIGAETAHHASGYLRLEGYSRAIADAGIPLDDSLIEYVGGFRRKEGAAAMTRLLDRTDPPDAVFCFSDPLALGAMWVLHQRGLRIPQDVAVVGFDDIEDGHYSTPTLTSVSPDKRFIAAKALELLSGRLDGGADKPPRSHFAPFELVVRDSSRAR